MKIKLEIFAALTAVIIWAFGLDRLAAQKVEFLSLDSEGSASVYTDPQRQTAFLLDGGRKGSLVRPRLDGKPVLEALLDRGMKHLVITCSHPHDDHAAGLLDVINSDSNITRFDTITFVDSDYPGAESLHSRFVKRWPQFPSGRVHYESAKKRDAFAFLNSSEGNCDVSNFVYEPPDGPATPHGQTIITKTALSRNGVTTRTVDFDDADSELVEKWATWAKEQPDVRRPDVIVVPHHSSDRGEIGPLLDSAIKPKACVITANSGNRFIHPGPTNWLKLITSLALRMFM